MNATNPVLPLFIEQILRRFGEQLSARATVVETYGRERAAYEIAGSELEENLRRSIDRVREVKANCPTANHWRACLSVLRAVSADAKRRRIAVRDGLSRTMYR